MKHRIRDLATLIGCRPTDWRMVVVKCRQGNGVAIAVPVDEKGKEGGDPIRIELDTHRRIITDVTGLKFAPDHLEVNLRDLRVGDKLIIELRRRQSKVLEAHAYEHFHVFVASQELFDRKYSERAMSPAKRIYRPPAPSAILTRS